MLRGHWYELQGLPTTCLCSIYLKKINGNYSVNLILVKGLVNPTSQAGKKHTSKLRQNSIYVKHQRAEVSLLTTEWQHSAGWQQDRRSMTFLLGLQYFHKQSKSYIFIFWLQVIWHRKGLFSAAGRAGNAEGPATRTKIPSIKPNHNSPSGRQIVRQNNYYHWQ